VPVEQGESGAVVVHDPERHRYAKVVADGTMAELAGERDRVAWLEGTGIPGPVVLDWIENDAGACLVTRAVPGVPANRLDPPALRRAWPSIAATARDLHSLATESCPFRRGLAEMVPLARATVAEDRVIVGFLPVALQQTPPTRILERIEAQLPARLAQERAELVVCHGDLCLPNILVDPATDRVTGLVDLGRLGTADPYADLALLLTTARTTWPDEETARRADRAFAEGYATELDAGRLDFYLWLDPLTW
jgi:streptomycin 3"-kinase